MIYCTCRLTEHFAVYIYRFFHSGYFMRELLVVCGYRFFHSGYFMRELLVVCGDFYNRTVWNIMFLFFVLRKHISYVVFSCAICDSNVIEILNLLVLLVKLVTSMLVLLV